MNEERRQILQMLAAGMITADEAERLIVALQREPASASSSKAAEPTPNGKPKYLRLIIDAQDHEKGPGTVNIRVPLQLLRAGVKLTSLIPAHARSQIKVNLPNGEPAIDLGLLKPEHLEEIISQLGELTIDVDQKNGKEKVRIFCE